MTMWSQIVSQGDNNESSSILARTAGYIFHQQEPTSPISTRSTITMNSAKQEQRHVPVSPTRAPITQQPEISMMFGTADDGPWFVMQ